MEKIRILLNHTTMQTKESMVGLLLMKKSISKIFYFIKYEFMKKGNKKKERMSSWALNY